MKNRRSLMHHHQSAKIYQQYYKPSINFFLLLKSVLSVFISGSSAVASVRHRRK